MYIYAVKKRLGVGFWNGNPRSVLVRPSSTRRALSSILPDVATHARAVGQVATPLVGGCVGRARDARRRVVDPDRGRVERHAAQSARGCAVDRHLVSSGAAHRAEAVDEHQSGLAQTVVFRRARLGFGV